jgi:hypothetical protein
VLAHDDSRFARRRVPQHDRRAERHIELGDFTGGRRTQAGGVPKTEGRNWTPGERLVNRKEYQPGFVHDAKVAGAVVVAANNSFHSAELWAGNQIQIAALRAGENGEEIGFNLLAQLQGFAQHNEIAGAHVGNRLFMHLV